MKLRELLADLPSLPDNRIPLEDEFPLPHAQQAGNTLPGAGLPDEKTVRPPHNARRMITADE